MTIAGSSEISLHVYETRLRYVLFPELAGEPDDALLRHREPPMTPSDPCVPNGAHNESTPRIEHSAHFGQEGGEGSGTGTGEYMDGTRGTHGCDGVDAEAVGDCARNQPATGSAGAGDPRRAQATLKFPGEGMTAGTDERELR